MRNRKERNNNNDNKDDKDNGWVGLEKNSSNRSMRRSGIPLEIKNYGGQERNFQLYSVEKAFLCFLHGKGL